MGTVLDINGQVNADTSYVDGELVARNTGVTLPEVTHVLATVKTALGEMEVPLYGLVETMESTIKKVGADYGLAKICGMTNKTIEHRWAQQITKVDGGEGKVVGCKAFLRGVPKVAVPSIEVETGSAIELEIPFSISRYQLFVDGKEIILVDKLAGICRINGTDYAEQVNSLL
nr:MAG TPA: major tail protein [Caudoviricetes sp.]